MDKNQSLKSLFILFPDQIEPITEPAGTKWFGYLLQIYISLFSHEFYSRCLSFRETEQAKKNQSKKHRGQKLRAHVVKPVYRSRGANW